jgi:hypothetical protein
MFIGLSAAIASSIIKYADNKKHYSANQEEMSNDTL